MPNRIIKESIKTSDNIDKLNWFEEVVFYRLLTTVDDYGCYDGRVIVLKNELFPTKETVTKKQVEDAIIKLESVGLVVRYTENERPYIYLPTWDSHQRVRNKHRKYPMPTEENRLTANCGQTQASCQSESNPIQSESNPNPNIYKSECKEVIDYLNEKAKTKYKYADSNIKYISARLREGFSVDDCKTVIDKKCLDWMGTEYEQYLRPKTLFSPEKFEGYLNANVRPRQKDHVVIDMPDYMRTAQQKEYDPEEELPF